MWLNILKERKIFEFIIVSLFLRDFKVGYCYVRLFVGRKILRINFYIYIFNNGIFLNGYGVCFRDL